MARLRVSVPAFKRKGGVRVHKYTKLVKDRGAPGRTPESKQWYEPREGALRGWQACLPASERRRILRRIVRREGYATAIRRLNSLRNVSTNRETDHAAKMDMEYLRRKYRPEN